MPEPSAEPTRAKKAIRRLRKFLEGPRLPLRLALVALALSSPALIVGWQSDDLLHRVLLLGPPKHFPLPMPGWHSMFTFVDGTPEGLQELRDTGAFPWTSAPDLRLNLWRPLTCVTHLIDYTLWPNLAWPMHLHSLLWDAALVALATIFFRRLIPSLWVSGLAAFLYAFHMGHGLPAAWLANRNAVVAAFFSMAALLAHDKWRRDGWKPGAALAPAALMAGLFGGEAAVAACGYLFAYALFIDRAPLARRLAALVPCAIAAMAWAAAYKLTGHGTRGSEMYIDPGSEPGRYLAAAALNAPILFLGLIGPPISDASGALSESAYRALAGSGAAFAFVAAIAFAPLIRRERVARFFALGALLALAPPSATLPSSRLMLQPAFGAMGLVALMLSICLEGGREALAGAGYGRTLRAFAAPFALFFALLHLAIAPLQKPLVSAAPLIMEAVTGVNPPYVDGIEGKAVISANAPNSLLPVFVAVKASLTGQPFPARFLNLASSNHAVEIERLDERSLRVEPEFGFLPLPGAGLDGRPNPEAPAANGLYLFERLERLTRAHNRPFALGDKVRAGEVEIEVSALTPDGRPAEAIYRFPVPLEDPRYAWFDWDRGYRVWSPPKTGEKILMPPAIALGGDFLNGLRASKARDHQ